MKDANAIAKLLNDIADKLEFLKENRYKIAAFRNGADAIKKTNRNIEELINKKKLSEIPGIGKSLESVIYEFCSESYSTLYNELLIEVPAEIEKLLKIKALTHEKIKLLNSKYGIRNLGDLEAAIREKQLDEEKGYDVEFREKILNQIELHKEFSSFVMLSVGFKYKSLIEAELKKLKSIEKYSITDELRRGLEVISSVQFVLLIKNLKNFEKEIKEIFDFEKEKDKFILADKYQVPVIFYITKSEKEFAEKLFSSTGSHEFVSRLKHEKKITGNSEEDIFKTFGLPYIIPEMREEQYFEAKEKLIKNSELTSEKLKGLLHFHSNWSDGKETMENMLTHADKSGYKFAAICDHSKFAYYANGMTEDRVLNQTKELKKLGEKLNLQLFQGVECDILKDGSLDFDNNFLPNFDFVVISVHKRFTLTEKEMTNRMVKAIENPYADLLGHPSGRFILQRAPYEFNVKKIIDACAANEVAVEINSNPKRLDLDWRWIYYAREKGCLFSINSDAHSIPEINFTNFGVKLGKKGGLQPSEVINCFETEKFRKFLNRKVKRKFKIPQKKKIE